MDLADRAAAGHQTGWENLWRLIGQGWIEIQPGYVASVTGMPAPPFNGASVYGAFDPVRLTAALHHVVDSGLPFCLQARPVVADAVAEIATTFDMVAEPGMPMMAITRPPVAAAVDGLTVRRLAIDEGELHASIAAEAFDAPIELMRLLTTPEIMGAGGGHLLVGELDGEAVATAVSAVNGATTGIFNVATLPAHRGRGIGAAITAAAVQAGFDDGSELAFLLSSPMGERVYESIGFRRLEHWSIWVAAGI